MRGRFIVCEGTDGSGKATQAALLKGRLQKEAGKKVLYMDFPQYEGTFSGKLVGRYLNGEFGKNVDPHLTSLPYALDRFEAGPKIRSALSQGWWVVASRYALANQAHQGAKLSEEKREEFIKFLEELEYGILGIPREDRYLYLYVPTDIGKKLVDLKGERSYLGGARRDILEDDPDHQITAASMYQLLSKMHPHITTINCCDSEGKLLERELVNELVWKEIQRLYGDELTESKIRQERERI